MPARIYKTAHGSIQLGFLEKSTSATITKQFVELDTNGLAVDATATSTAIAFVVAWGEQGSSKVQVVTDPNVVYAVKTDRAIVDTDRNKEVDLVIVSGELVVDLDASTTDVIKTLGTENFAVDTEEILCVINKPLTMG